MAMVLDSFVSILGKKLAALVEEEVVILFGAKEELVRLQGKLPLISSVLEDAEKKAFHDEAIRHWMVRLKDVMYDADDVIDEFRTKQLLQLVSPSSSYTSLPLCACTGRLGMRHQIGRRIKNINLKLDDISKDIKQFKLLQSTYSTTDQPSRASRSTYSTTDQRMSSPTVEPDVVGSTIEEDTKELVDMLTKEDAQRRSGVLVYAIAGIGGIGKTTLAQMIYNDPDIKYTFSIKAWVCVSKEFSEVDMLKRILTSVGGDHAERKTRDLLEPMVENAFSGEKFLLVLDDVWSDDRVWEDLLRKPLQSGARGSRILVTTRKQGVAKGMKAEYTHEMKLLSPEDGWSLICKKVLGSNGEEDELESLKDIGLEIVKKCDGLPLALKTIGGVLRRKEKNRRAWEGVLHNTTWSLTGLPEDVHRALYLSYEDLPPHLKQCFLYFALFPEDTEFYMYSLVMYWISEGFVRAEGDRSLEDVGEGYYRELLQGSFLQPTDVFFDGRVSKMHDLLWSLSQFLTKDESLLVHKGLTRSNTSKRLVKPPHRISVVGVGHEEIRQTFGILKKDKPLRTLFAVALDGGDVNIDDVNKRLRVLGLHGYASEMLPHSIGNLLHLRYLDLSGSSLGELPKSIGKLVNLEFMILRSCRNLRNLGDGVVKLQNLRCLDLEGTEVEGMPIGIGKLKNLNTIVGFVVNNNNDSKNKMRMWGSLEEVKSLSLLRRLRLLHLERAAGDVEIESYSGGGGGGGYGILTNKKHLSRAILHCDYGDAVEEEMKKRIEEVFELLLCPPPGIEELVIRGYYGINFPSWISSSVTAPSFLPNLRHLHLHSCIYFGILPPLGNLPNLESLQITGARSVITIGPEFLRSSSSSTCSVLFPKLTSLRFDNMPNWERWEWEEEEEQQQEKTKKNVASMSVQPRLIKMKLIRCPKLRHHPVAQLSSFSFLKELRIESCPNLESITGLPLLQHLELEDYEMERLPEWLLGGQQQFPALRKLEIGSSIRLLRSCLEEGSPDWSKIQHFPRVYGYSKNKTKYFSYTRSGGSKPPFNTNILDDDSDSE